MHYRESGEMDVVSDLASGTATETEVRWGR